MQNGCEKFKIFGYLTVLKTSMEKVSFVLRLMLIFLLLGCTDNTANLHFSETVKVALRDVGNTLLLSNRDSTSRVLPITNLSKNRYQLAFENKLSITPDSLMAAVNKSLKVANLPKQYIVEVFNCNSNEVFYSFQIKGKKEQNIVPCVGRNLPADCYTIQVLFLENKSALSEKIFYWIIIILPLILIVFLWLNKYRNNNTNLTDEEKLYSKIGDYKFYKDQNKLIKKAVEIKLSTKECELISILSANQNQIVKRETLVKEIWEDHGVFVDRSLDTFISKLRKKFKDDASISIVNVHGVGYKLEVK